MSHSKASNSGGADPEDRRETVVIREQLKTSVYLDAEGDVVIRQVNAALANDDVVIIQPVFLSNLIESLRTLAEKVGLDL